MLEKLLDGGMLRRNLALISDVQRRLVRTIRLDQVYSKFSRQKKAIMQLEVVEKWSMLLCLCDSYVCLHDLASFNFIKKIRTTKYCNTFCTLEDEGMLCCAVNKQLLVFKWNGQQFLDYNELNLPSNPRVISFLGPAQICVGLGESMTCSTLKVVNLFVS